MNTQETNAPEMMTETQQPEIVEQEQNIAEELVIEEEDDRMIYFEYFRRR